jgi:hypothetical protein
MPDEEKEIYYKLNAKQNELVEAEWEDKNKPIIAERTKERKSTLEKISRRR